MNSDLVSYELARDMAEVANTAHTVLKEAETAVDAAQLIEKANISGVALEAGSLAVLAGRYRVAGNSFVHANNSVPNFYTEVLDDTVTSDATTPENTNPEALTPEEQAYKEAILEGFAVSHESYASVMDVMNGTKARKAAKNKLPVATEAEARRALEAILTPAQIRAEMAQIVEFTTNPEANSPEAGFDTVFVADKDLTTEDETVLANVIQSKLKTYKGEAYVYEPLHNDGTAHRGSDSGVSVRAIRTPRHLNVRAGNVATQKATVEAHNNNPDVSYKLEMADDLTAMSHIALLVDTGAINTTNPNYDEKRFWATYYKNVLATPVDGYVPNVYVNDDGQLGRDGSYVYDDRPSRALVVPKA